MPIRCDVAIIGGGPAGSTAGTLLKKYNPDLSVLILEKERFPRDHVGESQLPLIGRILHEMGCWEKCEAANFPIKVGATYRWGNSDKLWDFNFVDPDQVEGLTRPGKYEGVRVSTAWQVDRAVYDKILLDHAESMGCEVRQETMTTKVHRDPSNPDRISALDIRAADGTSDTVEARHYIDASGNAAIIRRAMQVKVDSPTTLQNVAFWDYWENTDWAVEIGVGGTRVQVLSLGCGWIWFIPLGPTRTSIGFICPAEYYKQSGKTPEDLYAWACRTEPRVRELTANATRRGKVEATKDWSFLAERLIGENWLLAGECAGFADPILAGGMMLTHSGARHAAYTILELDRGELPADWLKSHYSDTQRRRIKQHIRFADFWYAGNGQFTDLEEHTSRIAKDAGLSLRPKEAFRWLSTGGFSDDVTGFTGIGGLDLGGVKQIAAMFGDKEELEWEISKFNHFELNLRAAELVPMPVLKDGRILRARCYTRADRRLPAVGMFQRVIAALEKHSDIHEIAAALRAMAQKRDPHAVDLTYMLSLQALESMLADGWVTAKHNRKKPLMRLTSKAMSGNIMPNTDELTQRIENIAADN
ncbi:MAG: NAD(P)/FAD-dependent oxidoreductase [Planctomycetota bacterium]|nr:MAG: NAD(P)/FAD-dependent oxidoreductase [Planctomycetota bacterium]